MFIEFERILLNFDFVHRIYTEKNSIICDTEEEYQKETFDTIQQRDERYAQIISYLCDSSLTKQGYELGFKEGNKKGYEEGYDKGFNDGCADSLKACGKVLGVL